MLLAIGHFKPEETEPILPGRSKDDFSDPPLKQKAGAFFIYSIYPRRMLVVMIQSLSFLNCEGIGKAIILVQWQNCGFISMLLLLIGHVQVASF